MIGKSLNPRCFKGFNKSALPVTYRANSKAWMRADIFIEWLQHLDSWFRTMDQKILLLIDNAGSHFNPKILDESNNTNEEVSDDDEEEEIIAESSHSAQSRKRRKKPKQSKRKKPIKKPDIKKMMHTEDRISSKDFLEKLNSGDLKPESIIFGRLKRAPPPSATRQWHMRGRKRSCFLTMT